jgi:hypothetical protein
VRRSDTFRICQVREKCPERSFSDSDAVCKQGTMDFVVVRLIAVNLNCTANAGRTLRIAPRITFSKRSQSGCPATIN